MSEANAGGVGGLFLLRASKSPPTRLASLATLPATGREGKDPAPSTDVCIPRTSTGLGFRRDNLIQFALTPPSIR